MNDVLNQLATHRIVPICSLPDASCASAVGDALLAGGLPVAEVTFRTAAAEEAIRTLSARGDLLVGAGTVLTVEQADRAIDAGAQFVVAPGLNPKVVTHCLDRGVCMAPLWLGNPQGQETFAFLHQHELIRNPHTYDSAAATSGLFD